MHIKGIAEIEGLNMNLSNLVQLGSKRKSKRVGRGYSSGKGGHTTGKGAKGQNSRAGHKFAVGFEGGQVPLYKRMPQLGGFRSPRPRLISSVGLSAFSSFKAGTEVTPLDLVKVGVLKNLPKNGVKVLNSGSLDKKLTFKGFIFSKTAQASAEKAGAIIA